MKFFTLLVVLLSVVMGVNAHATLAGKNVILVNGFRAADLQEAPSSEAQLQQLSEEYFSEFWTSRAEAHHFWSSADRVTGAIKDQFRRHFEELESNGLCVDGCIYVTHSTGDLVLRDALSRLGQWGIDQNRVKILLVLDLAGAGGGTELADVAATVANGGNLATVALRSVASAFLGFDIRNGNLGVLEDLRPARARSIATSNQAFPRLRFAGTGTEFIGVTKPFILGSDDSVVPLHSACASRTRDSFQSCSRSVRANGELRSSDGPSSFLFNNFVVLMGASTGHGNHISNRADGELTTVNNNGTVGGVSVDFVTRTSRRIQNFFRRVRVVVNSASSSMSANIFNTLNN